MGVKYGKDVLYSVTGLYMKDIGVMLKGLAREANMQTPTIDVDCSNVCFKVGNKDAQSVANFLIKWSQIGAKVTPMVAQAKCEVLEAELARANMERMVDWEQNSDSPVSINPTLKRAVGMDVHQELPSFVNPNKFFTSTPQPPKKKKKKKDGKEMKPRHENVNDPPIFTPSSLSDADVQRRTGFPTMNHLLSYIFIICNGETDVILERWTDIYGPCEKYCRRAIALKYNIERRARNSYGLGL